MKDTGGCSKCGHKYKALRIGKEACCKENREEEFKLRQVREAKEAEARKERNIILYGRVWL